MKTQHRSIWTLYGVLALLCLVLAVSCKRLDYKTGTTEDVNIVGYLEKYPEQYSLMAEMVSRSGAEGFLGAYGSYTLFTPTNTAIQDYLKSINKTSVGNMSVDEAKKFVYYHLISDTISTKKFSDGKIQRLTEFGQYITTKIVNTGGVSSYVLNNSAKVLSSNIRVGNGIIHVIDHVLLPKTLTLGQLADAAGARYSIFLQALKETGFYDSLNVAPANVTDSTRRFQTLIAESDSALNKAGFANYAALKARLSKTGNPKSHADSLWLYVAYHISPGASYLADVAGASALVTLAPSEIVSTSFSGNKVLLNEVEFNGTLEPGVELNRSRSDQSASNGVLHDARDFFRIKVRVPTAIYWDFELDGLSQNPRNPLYQSANILLYQNGASFSPGNYVAEGYKRASTYTIATATTGARVYNKGDYMSLSISGPGSNLARPLYHDFRTPLLVKGLYKVWLCYATSGANATGNSCQCSMNPGTPDEQVFPNLYLTRGALEQSGVNLSAPNSDALLEAAGWKRYMATTAETAIDASGKTITGNNSPTNGNMAGRLLGIANIRTTGRHWFRVKGFSNLSADNNSWLDMVHFIPVDQDQLYPRFSVSGTRFKRP